MRVKVLLCLVAICAVAVAGCPGNDGQGNQDGDQSGAVEAQGSTLSEQVYLTDWSLNLFGLQLILARVPTDFPIPDLALLSEQIAPFAELGTEVAAEIKAVEAHEGELSGAGDELKDEYLALLNSMNEVASRGVSVGEFLEAFNSARAETDELIKSLASAEAESDEVTAALTAEYVEGFGDLADRVSALEAPDPLVKAKEDTVRALTLFQSAIETIGGGDFETDESLLDDFMADWTAANELYAIDDLDTLASDVLTYITSEEEVAGLSLSADDLTTRMDEQVTEL